MADSELRKLPPDPREPVPELVPPDFESPTLVPLALEGRLASTNGTLALCEDTIGLTRPPSNARGRGSDEPRS